MDDLDERDPSSPEWAINLGLTKGRESQEPRVHFGIEAPLNLLLGSESGPALASLIKKRESLTEAISEYVAARETEAADRDAERVRRARERSAVDDGVAGPLRSLRAYRQRRGRGGHEFRKR